MVRKFQRWTGPVIIAVAAISLLVSLVWRSSIGACDYIVQAGMVLLTLVLPFCACLESKFGWQAAQIFFTTFVWGIWRIGYFDPVTRNDVPGFGYVIMSFTLTLIAAAIFVIRKFAVRMFS
jgi:glucose dehydrogenase